MKRIIPFFLLLFFAATVYSQTGTHSLTVNIENHETVSGLTEIEYTFPDDAPDCDYHISAKVSFDNGNTYQSIDTADLEGDLSDVTPEGLHSLTWHGGESFPDKYSEQTVIRIIATSYMEYQPSEITGETAPCAKSSVSYNVTQVGGVTYTWAVPDDWNIDSGQGTHSITVTVGTASGTIEVKPSNACGDGPAQSLEVTPLDVPDAPTAGTHDIGTTTITWNWSTVADADGFKYNTDDDYGTATATTSPSFTQEGLDCETEHNLYVWAYNDCGESAVVSLTATTEDCPADDPEPGTVTDIDGNVYQTVIIGGQEWMAENLRVTKYKDGDDITTDLNDEDWEDTIDGAYAIYDNDEDMLEAYGKLYNWYAVADARGLCPDGWRVPTDADWTELVTFIGSDPGRKLKSARTAIGSGGEEVGIPINDHPRWDYHADHFGLDEFCFSALPGSSRLPGGSFNNLGNHGTWWSVTEDNISNAWGRYLFGHLAYVISGRYTKDHGFSVRCVRD